jgi:hypothetical protein
MKIWHTMDACIEKGLRTPGVLPGGLNVRRRAPNLADRMRKLKEGANPYDWVSAWAMAVNEENAAGSRVVTAPTNGAAGIVPAVLKYFVEFCNDVNDQAIMDFLMTAAVIGMLFKHGASISAAEVGCQGEVVRCQNKTKEEARAGDEKIAVCVPTDRLFILFKKKKRCCLFYGCRWVDIGSWRYNVSGGKCSRDRNGT